MNHPAQGQMKVYLQSPGLLLGYPTSWEIGLRHRYPAFRRHSLHVNAITSGLFEIKKGGVVFNAGNKSSAIRGYISVCKRTLSAPCTGLSVVASLHQNCTELKSVLRDSL